MRRSRSWTALYLGLGLAATSSGSLSAAGRQAPRSEAWPAAIGVVVEEVTPESLGARAGLEPGDLLLSWCRASPSSHGACVAAGRLDSSVDFDEMEVEEAPRGGLRLLGTRAGASTAWFLLPGTQSVQVRPRGQVRSSKAEAGPLCAGRGLAAARDLQSQGARALQFSELESAETFLRQALTAYEVLAPESSQLAATLRSLCGLSRARQDLAGAKELCQRAISIQERLAPAGLDMASLLTDLGELARTQGDYAGAEELFRRAKAIGERVRPRSLERARALRMLGILAADRRDNDAALYFLQQALALEEELDDDGAAKAHTLMGLGLQALERGDAKQALELLRRATSLYEQAAPNGPGLAGSLQNLGVVESREGQCAAAGAHFQQALAIRERLNPAGLEVAKSLRSLGFMSLRCGDLAQAEDFYRRALAIHERLAPDGVVYAQLLHDLGIVYLQQGRPRSAVEPLCRAADLDESREASLGRAGNRIERTFTDCVGALVEVGRWAEAFHVLERGRARAFLDQLTERKALLSAEVPEALGRRRRELEKELESAQAPLVALSSIRDAAEVDRLLAHLQEIRDQLRALTEQIRRSSPRLASLRYPEPLDLAAARRALDPGTVLLSYLPTDEETLLFVVEPAAQAGPGLYVFTAPVGRNALGERVDSFRQQLRDSGSNPAQLAARGRELYDLLIAPAAPRLAKAKRLLVSAGGPLLTLPFAALSRQGRYLVEWKPIHFVLSATVYAELKRTRHPDLDPGERRIVAFGDPVYPHLAPGQGPAPALSPEVLTALSRGLSLAPIPGTRQEVETIARLFPRTRVFVGREATEEQAKSAVSRAQVVHFACHGLFDERFPLDSALALTLPEPPAEGKENGLLHAWEIMESLHLEADLVTLSACDTGLGALREGDGLVGLTRAFQYAGAQSVLASLWGVSDASTATLMKRFYLYLRREKTKDDALRRAQVDLIRSRRLAHPYHWAAFGLFGDWR